MPNPWVYVLKGCTAAPAPYSPSSFAPASARWRTGSLSDDPPLQSPRKSTVTLQREQSACPWSGGGEVEVAGVDKIGEAAEADSEGKVAGQAGLTRELHLTFHLTTI